MGRILALDVGDRRIGLAVSDPERRLAVPLRIVDRTEHEADMSTIVDIARAEGIDELVVGNPISMTGEQGAQSRRARSFGERLAKVAGLPLVLWDERLSSAQAERSQGKPRGSARSRKQRRRPTDDVAAALFLQSYLDRLRAGAGSPEPS
jgi:putative Holliday junction resolvase